jgi:aryl-alcohol dehydrogenase-like predicted oxidoreductase
MRIDLEASRLVIDKAIDLGITLFDTADIYGNRGGSETILGEVLGSRREKIVLATKFSSFPSMLVESQIRRRWGIATKSRLTAESKALG